MADLLCRCVVGSQSEAFLDDDVAQSQWRLAVDDEGHDVVTGWKRESQRQHRCLADRQCGGSRADRRERQAPDGLGPAEETAEAPAAADILGRWNVVDGFSISHKLGATRREPMKGTLPES